MCGIAGIATLDSAFPYVAAAQAMAAALSHRGPDSAGVECLGPCVLANRRLAIIDLSDRGRQPMSNEEKTVWITYNGESYNASELRQELITSGYRFRSTTDTEVVLHLYEELGEKCVERLRGMFACAIWDARAQKLLLARDRLGIKPLYYAILPQGLLFASEMKALLASGLISRRLNPAGLRAFLQLGHIPPPWTAIDTVRPLEPGQFAIWKDGRLTREAYWNLRTSLSSGGAPPPRRLATEVGDVFLHAMRSHLVSDVPIVLFLSGGIDSACLAAAGRYAGAQNLTAMSVGFPEAEFDETELSRRTAEALGIPLHVVTLPADRVGASLDHAIWAMDQPTVDGLNSYWIARLAAETGFKVAISGQGGDELFGGYESLAWFQQFDGFARRVHPLHAKVVGQLLDQAVLPFRWRKLSYLFGARDPFVASQLAVKVLFLDRDLRRFLVPPLSGNGPPAEAERHLTHCAEFVKGLDLKQKVSFMDIHTHLEPRLLRDMDAMSMAHSLEVRPVLLDHQLVEFLLPLPSEMRIRQKRLLLEATKRFMPAGLHQDLLARRKRTFTFPFAPWLRRSFRETLSQTFVPERLRSVGVLDPATVGGLWRRYLKSPATVGWSRIWGLFVLQRWCEAMQLRP